MTDLVRWRRQSFSPGIRHEKMNLQHVSNKQFEALHAALRSPVAFGVECWEHAEDYENELDARQERNPLMQRL